jgi:hypothetical protein
MRPHIKIENYGSAELSNAESTLREQGYRLVRKNSENDLLPGEYIRQKRSWSLNSLGEQRRWVLRWRVS